jgi:peptidoglycan/xylan/chitin deacetylase (PgdA/CDA1 family)
VPVWDQRANHGTWTAIDREQFLWNQLGRRQASDAPAPRVQVASELLIASADMLRALPRAAGISFGNHTMTHPNLAALTTDEVRREIAAAWCWLNESLSDAIVPVVAYPYGLAPRDAASAIARDYADFGLRVTGNWQRTGALTDRLAFPRWNVPTGISTHGFRVRLRGYLAGR